jgi:NET1-associated nuclear protein 1 (U3 small nucleolar RNA-associated protein 17)
MIFSLTFSSRFVFLATKRGVHVYSTATSTLVRTLATNRLDSVIAYALSSTHPSRLYVANMSGSLILWDWQIGKEIMVVPKKWPIRALAVTQLYGTTHDTVFTIETEHRGEDKQSDHIVSRQFLPDKRGATVTTHVPIFFLHNQDLLFLKIVDGGNTIFASSSQTMIIGNVKSELLSSGIDSNPLLFNRRYIWRELQSNEALTCLDAKVRSRPVGHNLARSNKLNAEMYDLVCGGVRGTIYIYEDILHKLEEREAKPNKSLLVPTLFKWHREAVGAVKWSLDGE